MKHHDITCLSASPARDKENHTKGHDPEGPVLIQKRTRSRPGTNQQNISGKNQPKLFPKRTAITANRSFPELGVNLAH